MQNRDKIGSNNLLFGKVKSPSTIVKLTKLVYVYNNLNMSLIGELSTVNCLKHFNMGRAEPGSASLPHLRGGR
jgi:hypothetical protein